MALVGKYIELQDAYKSKYEALAHGGIAHKASVTVRRVSAEAIEQTGVDAELMQQAADIRDAVQPDEVLFVVDAMIGQDAVTTAQAFLEGVGYDAVVLTKLDGDARGGAALSIASISRSRSCATARAPASS